MCTLKCHSSLQSTSTLAKFNSFLSNFVSILKKGGKSISIHSDYQGVHFDKSPLSCLFMITMITEYRDFRVVTNLKKKKQNQKKSKTNKQTNKKVVVTIYKQVCSGTTANHEFHLKIHQSMWIQ